MRAVLQTRIRLDEKRTQFISPLTFEGAQELQLVLRPVIWVDFEVLALEVDGVLDVLGLHGLSKVKIITRRRP